MRFRPGYTLAAVVLAVATITASLAGWSAGVYVFKPLATLVVLAMALTAPALPTARYRGLIAAGLSLSLVGDVLLMLPGDCFVQGLVAFLAAHLCYIRAFTSHGGKRVPRWWLLPIAGFGALMLTVLRPGLGGMLVPVGCYVAVILVMFWQAAGRWWVTRSHGAALAALGAAAFVVSDGSLAVNRFRAPFSLAVPVVLGTYYLAQLLISWSVGHPDSDPRG
jgi:uncharacterized membrane protein YhhN